MKTKMTEPLLREVFCHARRLVGEFAAYGFRSMNLLLLLAVLSQGLGYPLAGRLYRLVRADAAEPTRRAAPSTGAPPKSAQDGQVVTVFGPQRYTREQGQPTADVKQFSLPPNVGTKFTLVLHNGEPDGSKRATSATAKLNGVEVIRARDLNQKTAAITRTGELAPDNTLEVRIAGAPGSFFTITITAVSLSPQPPPSLLALEPQHAAQGQTLQVTLRGRNTHWETGLTRASLGGEVSVGGAPAGELGPVTVLGPTTAVAEVIVSPTAALAPRTARVVTSLSGPGNSLSETVSLADALSVRATKPPGAATATVATVAGTAGSAGFADGTGTAARFRDLAALAAGPDDALYVADAGNHRIRVAREQANAPGSPEQTVSTLAGDGTAGFADGPAAAARFNDPQGVAVDSNGAVIVADTGNHRVRRVAPDGTVSTLAGDGTPGLRDGAAAQARFNAPRGVAADNFGNVYVADSGNSVVRKITPAGEVSTVAGDGTVGSSDSPVARFDNLFGIACDGEHVFVYLGDTGNHRIRRLDATGAVVNLAGSERGFADGTGASARFAEPSGIALDGSGKVVVADAVNSLVRLVDPPLAGAGSAQAVVTLAGTGARGAQDGAGDRAEFVTPRGVAVAASSAVFVADTGNHTLRRVLLPPSIVALSPQGARFGQAITILGERFDARAPARNTVRFTRAAEAGGGQVTASVLSATRTALTVEVPPEAATGPVTVETAGGTATSPEPFELRQPPPPSIADFNPHRGPVGTTVTLTGANLVADGEEPAVTFLGVTGARLPALVRSASAGEVRVVVPNGAVTGLIELTHAGGRAVSPSPFTVDIEQDFQLTIAPSAATAVQGGTATYIVSVTSQQPSFSQLARLSVEGLPEAVAAVFDPPQITAGARATLSVALGSSGLAPGSYPFTVKAAAEVEGRELLRTTGATLNVLVAGQTTLSGLVRSTEDEPVMGATVSLDGQTATTDAAGAFLLSGVLAGQERPLMIDGRTASAPNRSYPVILEPADIVAGRANVVPYIYYLPPIDVQFEVEVVPGQDTAAGNPRVPDLQMIVPVGANLRNRDGSPVARVSITPLAIDRTPAPLPTEVATNLVYTSQPGGAVTDVPIPVIYPNLAGADPGTRLELYAFDHDLVRWYVYGFGRVSADGRTISPEIDPNTGRSYGLRDFSWHFPNAGPEGNPEGGDGDEPDCSEGSTGGKPVNFATGIKIEEATDVSFGGARGGLELTRVYTSDLANSCDLCPFGRGTTHNYAIRLTGTWGVGGAGRVVMPGEVRGRLFNFAGTDASGALVFATRARANLLGDVLRRLPDGTFEYRKADGLLMRFDAGGRLTAISDRNDNTTTLSYTGSNLTRVTDAVGRSLALEYDASGRVARVTDPVGRQWRYNYEGTPGVAGRPGLTTVTDPLGGVWRYTYAVGGRLASVTDPRGNVVKRVTYNAAGRVAQQQFADGGVEKYEYTLSGRLVTQVRITDPLGRQSVQRFNAAGYVLSSTDPLGQGVTYLRDLSTNLARETTGPCTTCTDAKRTFDARGNVTELVDRAGQKEAREYHSDFSQVTKLTDALGRATTVGYDARGNLLSITNALGQTTTVAYDTFGQAISATDALGRTTRTEYDARGNISAVVDPLGNRWSSEYDEVGRLTAKADPLGRRATYTYDALDRMLTSTDPSGAVTRYAYDANGNLTSVTDPVGRVRATQYDPLNRPVASTDPAGRVTRQRYNLAGELTAVITPTGRTLRYGYDARGAVISETDELGQVTHLSRDTMGNVTSVVDPRGNTTTFVYDELFRLTTTRNPLGQSSTFAYNAAGFVTEATDETGRRASLAYDALDRLVRLTLGDATVSYAYDAAGRPARADDSQGGSVEWVIDDANRIVSERTPAGLVSYGYNAAGQRTSMRAADRAPVSYEYDAAGRLQTIRQGAEAFTYDYDALSRLAGLARPNAVTTSYSYDAVGRLERLRHTDVAGQPVEDYRYSYTADNDIESITSLLPATQLPALRSVGPADAANRVTQSGDATYTFDSTGQTASKTDPSGTTQYAWDARGRLTQATLPDGRAVRYGYDALGRLASRTADGSSTSYLYDGEDVVLDRESGGSAVEYLNGGGIDEKLRQTSTATGPLYFLHDHLGSTAGLTGASGAVVERQGYTPFGESAGSSLTRFGFTGRERDPATGLLHYRARWYDPGQGRFLSEDPAGFEDGPNLYSYVGNDPVNFNDPTGLSARSLINGLMEGAATSFFQACLYAAVFGVVTCLTAGTALAALVPLLSLYMAAEAAVAMAQEIEALLTEKMCPDERHYRIGFLIGAVIGGGAGAKLGARLGKFCFAAGTLVQTEHGSVPIEEVKAGDLVLSANPEQGGEVRWQRVVNTFHRTSPVVLDVRAGDETITTTPEHPFWVAGRGWTNAADLRPGDQLLTRDNRLVKVVSYRRHEGQFEVYNFQVEGTHTYFVARAGVLVHNAPCKTDYRARKQAVESPPKGMVNPQVHHEMPQYFRKRFERRKIDIDDPKYTRWVSAEKHAKWSKKFNKEWANFFANNPRAGRKQMLTFMNKMKRKVQRYPSM